MDVIGIEPISLSLQLRILPTILYIRIPMEGIEPSSPTYKAGNVTITPHW